MRGKESFKKIYLLKIEPDLTIINDQIYKLILNYIDIEYIYNNFKNINKKIFYFGKEKIRYIERFG